MQKLRSTVHTLRQKPESVRFRMAIAGSTVVTAMVGLMWVTSLTSSGELALRGGSSAETPATSGPTNFNAEVSQFMGAIGGLDSQQGSSRNEPALTIIDGAERSTIAEQQITPPSTTVIPF